MAEEVRLVLSDGGDLVYSCQVSKKRAVDLGLPEQPDFQSHGNNCKLGLCSASDTLSEDLVILRPRYVASLRAHEYGALFILPTRLCGEDWNDWLDLPSRRFPKTLEY